MKDELDLDSISLICFILSIITMILSSLLTLGDGNVNMSIYVLSRLLSTISTSLIVITLWIPILPHLKGKFAFIAVLILILLIIFSMISKTYAQIAVMFLTIIGTFITMYSAGGYV